MEKQAYTSAVPTFESVWALLQEVALAQKEIDKQIGDTLVINNEHLKVF